MSKTLLELRSHTRRINESVNSELTVASSYLPTPQQQEGEHDISPIIPSSSKAREVTPALHDAVRSCKATGGVKVETIQNSKEVSRAVEENPLLGTEAWDTYDMQEWWDSYDMQEWWDSYEGPMEVRPPISYS